MTPKPASAASTASDRRSVSSSAILNLMTLTTPQARLSVIHLDNSLLSRPQHWTLNHFHCSNIFHPSTLDSDWIQSHCNPWKRANNNNHTTTTGFFMAHSATPDHPITHLQWRVRRFPDFHCSDWDYLICVHQPPTSQNSSQSTVFVGLPTNILL